MDNSNENIVQNASKAVSDFLTVVDVLDSIKRGKWIILAFFVIFSIGSSVYYYFQPNIYSSTAKLIYGAKQETVSFFNTGFGGSNSRALGNELEILKSRQFAEKVEMAMTDSVKINPDYKKYDLFNILANTKAPNPILGILMSNMTFSSPRSLDIITVTYFGYDPVETAIITNIISNVYIERNVNSNRTSQRTVKDFIKNQLDLRGKDLKDAENNLQQYMVSTKVVSLSTESEDAVKKIADMEAKINESKVQIGILEQQIKATEEELSRLEPDLANQSFDNVIDNFIKSLQMKIAEEEVKREQTIATSDMNNPIIKNQLETQNIIIGNYKKQLQDRITEAYKKGVPTNPLERTKSLVNSKVIAISAKTVEQYKIEKFEAILKEYDKNYQTIPAKNIEFARLTRARISAEGLYLALEKRYQEALIAEMQVVSDIKVIDAAIPSSLAVEPNRPRLIFVFSFIGLVIGLGFSILIKKLDNRIHKIEDIERMNLKILGQIPLEETMPKNGQLLKVIPNVVQELIRQIAINVTFVLNFKKSSSAKLILTTSTVPQEGKTFTAINLANSLTDMGNKVLLIDGDLRRPTIDKNLAIEKVPGLTELMANGTDPRQKVISTHGNSFDVLTSGAIPISPIPIISSYEFQKLLEEYRKQYNVIILDTPPSLSVGDVQIYSEYADGIIYVVGAEIANKSEIMRQYNMLLEKFGIKMMGTVLNKIRPDQMGAKGHYYYYSNKKE